MVQLKADLEENQNARRVLEQTVADRLPRVEARLNEAKRLLFNRDREIAELTAGAKRHKSALEEASSINAQQNAQIERLTTALTTRGGRGRQRCRRRRARGRGGAARRDRAAARQGARAGHADRPAAAPARVTAMLLAPPANGTQHRRRGHARPARHRRRPRPSSSRCVPRRREGDAGSAVYEREIRALRANAQDQAGEIARLKAALAAFEQQEAAGGLKDSKIALKARLGSAQAQADQQTATIAKLRAELAATHERLARQAAHFMGEMRRMGTGGTAPPDRGPGAPAGARRGAQPGRARRPGRGTGAPTAGRLRRARSAEATPARRKRQAGANRRGQRAQRRTPSRQRVRR